MWFACLLSVTSVYTPWCNGNIYKYMPCTFKSVYLISHIVRCLAKKCFHDIWSDLHTQKHVCVCVCTHVFSGGWLVVLPSSESSLNISSIFLKVWRHDGGNPTTRLTLWKASNLSRGHLKILRKPWKWRNRTGKVYINWSKIKQDRKQQKKA